MLRSSPSGLADVACLPNVHAELDLGTDETLAAESKLKQNAWEYFRRKIAEELSDINMLARCRNKFDREFRYDEHGVPRVWKPGDDIDDAFRRAREATFRIFPMFEKIGITKAAIEDVLGEDASIDEKSLLLLSEAKLDDLFTRVQRDMDITFTEAKRSVINTTAHVPPWMVLLMVFLGWNEAMALLSNPLYVFLLILGAITFYVLSATGLWGPAKTLALNASRQLSAHITETMDSNGVSLTDVGKAAKKFTSAALDAGSSMLDSHRAAGADVQMEPMDSDGEQMDGRRTPPISSRTSELRFRALASQPSTPGSFRSGLTSERSGGMAGNSGISRSSSGTNFQ